jgi:transposase-like protein
MMADHGITPAHSTILRWVQRYLPDFREHCMRFVRPVGKSWRLDETYIVIRGQ